MTRAHATSTAALLAGLATVLVTGSAAANAGGLAGYSGKPNLSSPAGASCNQCHSGGTAPTLNLTGPTTLNAGQVGEYTLVVTTGQARAAAGIAATDGVVLTPVSGVRESFEELVPNGSIAASGTAQFRFKVTAPTTGSAIKLWFVGLASNGSGTGGDRATHGTRDITIQGGAPPAGTPTTPTTPAGPTPGAADAGAPTNGATASGTGSGTTSGTGGATAAGSAPSADDDDDPSDGTRAPSSSGTGARPTASGGVACAVAAPGAGRGSLAFALLALAALGAGRRRR